MFRALLVVIAACSVHGIIVKDPLPTGEEYKYWYEVLDPTTGDTKSMHEVQLGDAVSGSYTVLDPDGTRRTVHYTADPYTGFKAVLVQEPIQPINIHSVAQEYGSENPQARFPARTQYTELYLSSLTSQPRPSHRTTHQRKYFTPAREIRREKLPINGLYFEPNNKFYE